MTQESQNIPSILENKDMALQQCDAECQLMRANLKNQLQIPDQDVDMTDENSETKIPEDSGEIITKIGEGGTIQSAQEAKNEMPPELQEQLNNLGEYLANFPDFTKVDGSRIMKILNLDSSKVELKDIHNDVIIISEKNSEVSVIRILRNENGQINIQVDNPTGMTSDQVLENAQKEQADLMTEEKKNPENQDELIRLAKIHQEQLNFTDRGLTQFIQDIQTGKLDRNTALQYFGEHSVIVPNEDEVLNSKVEEDSVEKKPEEEPSEKPVKKEPAKENMTKQKPKVEPEAETKKTEAKPIEKEKKTVGKGSSTPSIPSASAYF